MIMPRLAFEEPKGGPFKKAAAEESEPTEDEAPGRHRRDSNRDTVLVVLKGATVAVAIALMGVVILLATAGGDEPTAKAPAVPDIPTSHTATTGPTTTAPLGAMVAPEVRSQTTEIVPSVPPPVTEPTLPTAGPPPPGGGNQFVRVGDKCDTQGAYAFTESFQPVVCDRGRGNDQLTWRPMFR
jgi:hypothetical protein